jgi:hypothetical protein
MEPLARDLKQTWEATRGHLARFLSELELIA